MPDWVYLIAIGVFGTAMFFVGHYTGRLDADKCPSENAWINVRTHGIDANKECAMREMDYNHEEQMAMIDRGTFDRIDFSEDDENDQD